MAHLPFLNAKTGSRSFANGQKTIVDLHPWQTAQALAPLAVSAEEVEYAREVERLADHEVDQAFAAGLRQASAHARAFTGEALALSQKIAELKKVVQEDEAAVQYLTHAPANGAPPRLGRR